MKIKNKTRLVSRAVKHKEMDRFVPNVYVMKEYGRNDDFKGCLIGCLGMPTTRSAMITRIFGTTGAVGPRTRDLMGNVTREFGVCKALQRAGEAFLMSLPSETPQRLGGFTQSFCEALPEGRDVDFDLVKRWAATRPHLELEEDSYEHESDPDCEVEITFGHRRAEQKAFMSWLRRGCPEPRRTKANPNRGCA